MLPLTLALHALAAVVWVGGMAFAYGILRPVAGYALSGPERLALWRGVFARFFLVVWVAVIVLLVTGYYMTLVPFGGFAQAGLHIHTMHGLALLMAAIFAHLFFAPWQRFRRAIERDEPETAVTELGKIRILVALDTGLWSWWRPPGATGTEQPLVGGLQSAEPRRCGASSHMGPTSSDWNARMPAVNIVSEKPCCCATQSSGWRQQSANAARSSRPESTPSLALRMAPKAGAKSPSPTSLAGGDAGSNRMALTMTGWHRVRWRAREDSNLRLPGSKPGALSD